LIDKYIGHKVLITTDSWFVGPDGADHSAVWGTLNGVYEAGKHLGFIPNRAHANWYYEIGGMIIMGCQVKYFVLCPEAPEPDGHSWSMKSEISPEAVRYRSPHKILILE
jgi:arginase family enzyme